MSEVPRKPGSPRAWPDEFYPPGTELGDDGFPVGRAPTLTEIGAIPPDHPGRLAGVLAREIERVEAIVESDVHVHPLEGDDALDERLLAVEQMLGMKGETAERQRRFMVNLVGSTVRDQGERLEAVEAMLARLPGVIDEELRERAAKAEGGEREARRVLSEFLREDEAEAAGEEIPEAACPNMRAHRGHFWRPFQNDLIRARCPGVAGYRDDPVRPSTVMAREEALTRLTAWVRRLQALTRRAETAERERDGWKDLHSELVESKVREMRQVERRAEAAERGRDAAATENEQLRRDLEALAREVEKWKTVREENYRGQMAEHERANALETERDHLRRFKALTHGLLDAAGVPTFTGAPCRVGARIEWLRLRAQELDLDRLRDLVGSLSTYTVPEPHPPWLTELQEMLGMEA